MKTTAREIAEACGTSVSAVSRAFRADGAIAPDLRKRILSVAAEHGYVPPTRRARKRREGLSFAVVSGEMANPFNPLALERFASGAAALGWDMTAFIVPDTGRLDSLIEQVLAADLDAVVLAAADLSSRLAKECRDRALPVVFFNRVQVDSEMTAICSDNYGGGRLAGERLLAGGRRTIALVGGRRETSTHLERRRGLIDVLNAAGQGLEYDKIGNFDYATAAGIGRALFAGSVPPDGVFCANDNMGLAVIDAAEEAGLRPGVDVSIIGYDNVPMAGWTRYQLTTISQQVDQMVDRTIGVLERIAANDTGSNAIEIVPAKLIVRQSG